MSMQKRGKKEEESISSLFVSLPLVFQEGRAHITEPPWCMNAGYSYVCQRLDYTFSASAIDVSKGKIFYAINCHLLDTVKTHSRLLSLLEPLFS